MIEHNWTKEELAQASTVIDDLVNKFGEKLHQATLPVMMKITPYLSEEELQKVCKGVNEVGQAVSLKLAGECKTTIEKAALHSAVAFHVSNMEQKFNLLAMLCQVTNLMPKEHRDRMMNEVEQAVQKLN